MKNRWATLAFLLAACAALPVCADVTIVLIRHGEKPERGLGQLNCQGLNRALALPDVLVAKFGRPDALFAPDPGVTAEDFGQPYNYIRPLATIEPTAIRLGLPVDTRWGLANLRPLEDELLNPGRAGQLLVVAWEHSLAVQLARDILSRRGADPRDVPDWARDDFDSIYVLQIPLSGKASFRVDHEGLDGQSPACPGQK
jgi:hypothetical protein